MDVSEQLRITDHFVICSAGNERQVRTIAEEVERSLSLGRNLKPFRREGEREGRWVLLDYVDFVVHVFLAEVRDYYDLERLWSDAPVVSLAEDSRGGDDPASQEAARTPQRTGHA